MAILFVSGINDDSTIRVSLNERNKMVYLYEGNLGIQGHVALKDGIESYAVLFGKKVKQWGFNFEQQPWLIVNQIANPDTHKGALERCVELCGQTEAPVINRPEYVLQTRREQVSVMLQDIPGVTMPKTVRFSPVSPSEVFEFAADEGIDFPFIVRMAGSHGGENTVLISGPEDQSSLHRFPLDGRAFYLTQYVDCRDSAGLYHRQRLVIIDGKPLLRGSLYDEHWMVHGASRQFMLSRETWEDDRKRSERLETEVIPRLDKMLREITARLQLDIYGIDCSLGHDGEMVIFEANASMDFFTNAHPQMNERMNMISRGIQQMLARHSGKEVV